jgi:hypothetical protein
VEQFYKIIQLLMFVISSYYPILFWSCMFNIVIFSESELFQFFYVLRVIKASSQSPSLCVRY